MAEFHYDDNAVREDLSDFISNLSPTENTLYSGLGKVKAAQPYHQWLNDTLKAVGTNGQVEGFTPSYAARTRPTRTGNYTQIISAEVEVTETEREALQAGFADRYSYEMEKAMTEWVDDAEYALMRGGIASGTGSAARYMRGFKASVTTTVTSQSGKSLSETMLNDYFQNTWNVSRVFPDEVYVGGALKRRISGFTAGSTKFTKVEDKRLINTASVYESDFGVVKVLLHRYITVSGDQGYDILGIKNDHNKIAQLRAPKHVSMAKAADSTRGMIVGEITLEHRNELSSFVAKQHI